MRQRPQHPPLPALSWAGDAHGVAAPAGNPDCGAKLSDQSGEDPEDVAARLDALPPDLPGDTAAVASNEPARCDSFLGCLRDRWSRTR